MFNWLKTWWYYDSLSQVDEDEIELTHSLIENGKSSQTQSGTSSQQPEPNIAVEIRRDYSNGTSCVLNNKLQYHCTTGPALTERNRCEYWLNGKLHNENGPAIVYKNGRIEYWKDGKRHNENGPAVVIPEQGITEYWLNGEKHNENGPALITPSAEMYYKNGKLHNGNGPAFVSFYNKDREWWVNGVLHNLKGPARISGVNQEYWIHGIKYSEDEFNEYLNIEKEFDTLHST
jgi:hypothetical protein